jgi:hypothetical protein
MLGAMIWWVVDAHKWFKGPKVNIEHSMLGRDESALDGKEDSDGSFETPSISREASDKKIADLA